MVVQHNSISKRDYLLVTILIFLSGSPVAFLNNPIVYGGVGSLFFLYSLLRKDVTRRRNLWIYLLFLISIFICQYFTLGGISVFGSLNILAKVIFGATILWILKDHFRYAYLNVMCCISIISLFFLLLSFSGYILPDWFYVGEERRSILIHTTGSTLRNHGPFWEPGAFAAYLLLVPVLFIEDLKKNISTNWIKYIILLVALITTFSTTGYLCLFVVVLFFIIKNTKNKLITFFLLIPVLLYVISLFMMSLDFLYEKMLDQYKNLDGFSGEYSNQRFGALLFDLHYIAKHPLCGNGLLDITRFSDHKELWGEMLGHGNGFSDYLARMGVLSFFVYIAIFFRNVSNSHLTSFVAVLLIVLLLQGETLLNYPLFLGLPFIINSDKRYKNNGQIHRIKCSESTPINFN